MDEESNTDVFISYNSTDRDAVQKLYEKISKLGITAWFDQRELFPGDKIPDTLSDASRRARVFMLIIGKQGPSDWQIKELRSAIRSSAPGEKRIIPVFLPGAPSELHLPAIADLVDISAGCDLRDGMSKRKLIPLTVGIMKGRNHRNNEKPRAPQAPQPRRHRPALWSSLLLAGLLAIVAMAYKYTTLSGAIVQGREVESAHPQQALQDSPPTQQPWTWKAFWNGGAR